MRETPGSLDEMVSRGGHQNAENPGFDAGVLRCVDDSLANALGTLERLSFGRQGWRYKHLDILHFLDVMCTK